MKNIYTTEIETTGNLNIEKFLMDLSIVRINIDENNDIHSFIETLNNDITELIKFIAFQDKKAAIKQWKLIYSDLGELPNAFFVVLDKCQADTAELIEKYRLDPDIEKKLLGIVEASKTGTLND
jgi:hypothetical protein